MVGLMHRQELELQIWKVTSGVLQAFLFFSFFGLFFRPESHPDLWGNHSLHHPFLTWDNALIMMIITLLFTYNSILRTRYDSI